MNSEKTRYTLEDRFERRLNLGKLGPWRLSTYYFGDVGGGIHDFEMYNYTYLLDNSKSLLDLRRGLIELSPLADDALEVAEGMENHDFYDFKIALANERKQELDSNMPNKYSPLFLPSRFVLALIAAEKSDVPLGTALIQIMKSEENSSS